MIWKTRIAGAVLGVFLCASTALGAADRWPINSQPVRIMNTLSTLQYYGPKPGFHHGLDLMAPADTPVQSPVGGTVSTGYYYKRKSPYTYEIAIETSEGRRWEFHHLDPKTVPETVEQKAATGGRIEAGEPIGRIFDASVMDIDPHVHINVINAQGFYQNPLRFLPTLPDTEPPSIRGVYLETEGGQARCEDSAMHAAPGGHQLVVDAYDMVTKESPKHSLYALDVYLDGQRIGGFEFDQLPHKDFLKGAAQLYRLSAMHCPGKQPIENRISENAPRRFLYAVPLALSTPQQQQPMPLTIHARDFAGNTTEVTRQLTVINRPE